MNREHFLALLTKKISNELSENENALLQSAIAEKTEYAQIAKAIAGYHSANELRESYVQHKLKDVWTKIDNASTTEPVKKITAMPVFLKAAAIMLLVAGAGVLFLAKRTTAPGLTTALMDTIQSGRQKLYTTLDDGTQVTLNRNSSIIFNKEFGKEKRHIILNGEAFFDVAHNASKPFIVDAGNVNVTVKGTAFNINAYKDRKDLEVALIRGLVEVSNKYNKENKMLLRPEQVVRIPIIKTTQIQFQVDTIPKPERLLASLTDTLVFKKQRLEDLAKQLEKKYQVLIQIKSDGLKNKRFSGMFARETITEALDALNTSFPFSYKIEGTKVVIEN